MELLTTQEALAILKVSRKTLMDWVHEGRIPAQRWGRDWRFKREDLLAGPKMKKAE